LRGRRRGQVLVVAALAIALTIITVQASVYSLSRAGIVSDHDYLDDYILAIKQGSRHTLEASLVNVSRGGDDSNLEANLDRWEAFVSEDYRFGRCELNSTPASIAPYAGGVWLNWGVNGEGVSSACSDFTLNLSGRDVEVDWSFGVNTTTKVLISGSFVDLGGDSKEVNVIVNLLNEGAPSLAGSITLEYLNSSVWTDPTTLDGYSELDCGNGTYRYVFVDDIPSINVQIRAQVYDRRGIYVRAEDTLEEEQ